MTIYTRISNHVDRLPRTPFGVPLLDDYGQDDLNVYRDDIALEAQEVLIQEQIDTILGLPVPHQREQGESLILAVLDISAPAKPKRGTIHEDWSMDSSRQPDLWEDGLAWWIGEFGAVGYDAERWSQALSVCEDHGNKVLRAVMPSDYGLVVYPHYEYIWETKAFAKVENNLSYMLWTIAQSTLSN